ncbi:MAG: OmpH family outer membrane protein [Bacteroidota bacterium]
MNNKLQSALLIILTIGMGFLYYQQFASQKTVYVDSARLLNEYQGMIDARKGYQQKTFAWKANIDTLASETQKAINEYQASKDKMSKKEKQLSEELIRTKQRQLADYQKAMNEKAVQEDQQLTATVLEQVNAYLKDHGESHNYRIILAATDYGNIAYAQDGLDITEEVLAGLNKVYTGQ